MDDRAGKAVVDPTKGADSHPNAAPFAAATANFN
jgi:hypothetical protein